MAHGVTGLPYGYSGTPWNAPIDTADAASHASSHSSDGSHTPPSLPSTLSDYPIPPSISGSLAQLSAASSASAYYPEEGSRKPIQVAAAAAPIVLDIVDVDAIPLPKDPPKYDSLPAPLRPTNDPVNFTGQYAPFGAQLWRACFGVSIIGQEPPLPKELKDFWLGYDPADAAHYVYENYLPPLLITPEIVDANGTKHSINLATLKNLAQHLHNPVTGEDIAVKIIHSFVKLHAIKVDKVTRPYWVVMRKKAECRNVPYEVQKGYVKDHNKAYKARFEEAPSVLDLLTVLLAQYALNGKRYLSGSDGEEGRDTSSVCKETLGSEGCLFWKKSRAVSIGGFNSSPALCIASDSPGLHQERLGITLLRRFKA